MPYWNAEVPLFPRTPRYYYIGNCVEATKLLLLESIIVMRKQIKYRTFIRNVPLEYVKRIFPQYDWITYKGLSLKKDNEVCYWKSNVNGEWFYFITHSGIEHIWRKVNLLQTDTQDIWI